MNRSDLERLNDGRAHANRASERLAKIGCGPEEERADRFDAFLRDLIVIGTALGKVTKAVQALGPGLPWRQIVDTRNRLVHAYWQIDPALATVVRHDHLQDLIAELTKLIQILDADNR